MQQRRLGRTGLSVSVLGYGCGAIGGLMVRGTQADQDRAIGRAIDAGVTYFDTAAVYGDGASERNLGRVLRALGAKVAVGTKVRIFPQQRGNIAGTITASLEASLERLGRDRVDIFQLHNPITLSGEAPAFTPDAILGEAVPALEKLRGEGKVRWFGITGLGDAPALRRVLDEGGFATAQMPYNILNPSGVAPLPPGSAMPDLGRVIQHAASADVGVMAIRVLAGGALSGSEARSPLGVPKVDPIASGSSYADDVEAARRLLPLVEAGYAADLVELALRFAMMPEQVSTVLVGTSSLEELDHAVAAVNRGPLPEEALSMLGGLQAAPQDAASPV
ncbi:aldo/keto reductase [Roseomonas sp. SSH11]|uniref:Aldo/keto reductase n=1 Tax=Pararoseomonas baculiformis TaxID=2820812 RepID=A0ABS4AKK0_9PROT|nr:aldo/keto reductase [Pararoseomonas baculiformis]MBP0447583.1 aldo/keto reductase [Pararoseomonas baculiformis]